MSGKLATYYSPIFSKTFTLSLSKECARQGLVQQELQQEKRFLLWSLLG